MQFQAKLKGLRNREANGVSPSLSNGLRTGRGGESESKGLRTGELKSEGRRRWTSQLKQRTGSPFLCHFILFRPSASSCPYGEGDPSYLVYQFKCESLFETLLQTHLEIMVYQGVSLNPAKLTHKINHHTISSYSW